MQDTTVKKVSDPVVEENRKSLFPTQIVDLPSKGKVYPLDSPLSTGKIEIKYMTAKEEDILTTESYIRSGVVLDKLLQSLIVDPAVVRSYGDLITGDKNALLIAARLYGYGQIYDIEVTTPSGELQKVAVDLNDLVAREIEDESIFKNENRFSFTLPRSGDKIEFKFLTVSDDKAISDKLKKSKPIGGRDPQLTERLSRMILSAGGNDDPIFIRLFTESMLAVDSRAFREYVAKIQPNVNMEIEVVDEATNEPFRTPVTLGSSFFWPEL